MNTIDLALFDLDGTLVDTLPDIAAALGATLAGAAVPTPPVDVVRELVGDGARELIRRALARAELARDVDRLHATFLTHYRAHVSDRSRVYPGVTEALAALRGAGVTVSVVTNKPGDIARRLLANVGLGTEFACVVGDGDGLPRKPDPTAARELMTATGTTAARTAVVGDGLPDMRLGRALGACAVAACWGYVDRERLAAESPDHLAATPAEAVRFILTR